MLLKYGTYCYAAGIPVTVRLFGCFQMVWPLHAIARQAGSRAFSMHGRHGKYSGFASLNFEIPIISIFAIMRNFTGIFLVSILT